MGTKKDIFDEQTLRKFYCVLRLPGTKSKSMITNALEVLVAANEEKETMKEEISSLKEEKMRQKEKMKKDQVASATRFGRLVGRIQGESSSNKALGPQSS